jgi:hypothetical protein
MKTLLRVSTLGLLVVLGVMLAPRPRDAAAASSATLTGQWTITISTEQGDFDTNWDLTQHDDGTLTGDIEGRQGSAEAAGGWVKDDAFGFSVSRDFQEQSFEIDYEGTFSDDALEGTLTAGGGQFTADFTGVRAGGDDR